VAVFDLLEDNAFKLPEKPGPYIMRISLRDGSRLDLKVENERATELGMATVSLVPLRRIIKDYFLICESYHNAIRTGTSQQIEAIDMGRRGLHNEGSRMVEDALKNFVEVDFVTARRLYTLICSLHRRPGS
jgi:uncharacterized protein (UPF0262 family)